jgi:two-component system heavy metal sensor histidine kinase CusS
MNNNRPASLVLRVTLLVGIATTVSLIALGIFVQRSIGYHFISQEAEELQVIEESVRSSLALSTANYQTSEMAEVLEGAVAGHHGVYFLVADDDGSIIYTTPGPDLFAVTKQVDSIDVLSIDSLYEWNEDGSIYSGAVLHVPIESSNNLQQEPQFFTVVVAASMDEHYNFLSDFNRSLWGIIIGITLFAILAAWIAARQAHAPLHILSAKVSSISTDQLHVRLDEERVPVELAELVSSFNTMIVKMEDVFERLSNFSADIAHELRTPITNIITQTEVSLNKARDVSEYKEILYSNLEEYERLAKMISDMLFLAQTNNGLIQPTFQFLKLKDEVKDLFEYYEALAEERQVNLVVNGKCPGIHGDRSMLRRALSNLLSNAIDHTPPEQSVVVSLESNDEIVILTIENPGIEISAEQLPKIFDRFYQADPSRQREGAGLGLAIVKSIIEIHSGTIRATSLDGITRFEVKLPNIA